MNIADAREAYLNWNQKAQQDLIEKLSLSQQQAIKLIPLLFQINHRLLPGYNGPDSPAGIYAYKINKTVLSAANQYNKKFHYEQESVLTRCIIQSVFLQTNILDNKLLLWIIHSSEIKSRQLNELQDKLDRIVRWLQGLGLKISAYLSTEKELLKKIKRHKKNYFSNHYLLNSFYAEAILLAGKCPVWWLVPEEEEKNYKQYIEHALQVKLLNENSFIDLGCEPQLKQNECLKQLIDCVKSVSESAEKAFIELLIFYSVIKYYPQSQMPVKIIKQQLHKGVRYYASLLLYPVMLNQLQAIIEDCSEDDRRVMKRLLSYLANNSSTIKTSIFSDLSAENVFQYNDDVFEKVKLYKSLYQQIKIIADNIFTQCASNDESLNKQLNNMLALLSEKNNKVPIYVRSKQLVDSLDKVLLRQEINSQWTLVLSGEEGEEKTLPGFENPLSLLAWLWLNRLVTSVTQISIDCPNHDVLQVEAYQLLNNLIQRLDYDKIVNISPHVYENPASPILLLVFVNARTNSCEQLMLNSWGDVYCFDFSASDSMISCLCEWTHHLGESQRIKSPEFFAFGYSAGDANYLAQRMEQIFNDVFSYFYDNNMIEGEYIVNMNEQYYRLNKQEKHLSSHLIGQHMDVLAYLESANKNFIAYGLERYTLTDSPLREIFKKNKEHVVQVFFRLAGRNAETWVVDEKGSVWSCSQLCLDKDAYITQWLYFFHHIFARLKKIKYQQDECPTVEMQQVSINPMGAWEFFPVSSETLSIEADFFNVQLLIESVNHQEQMSLVCDEQSFDYQNNEQDALSRCVQYIRRHSHVQSRKPIYLIDMDLPLRLYNVQNREDIQTVHFLKYKRRFEKKLNQMVSHSV